MRAGCCWGPGRRLLLFMMLWASSGSPRRWLAYGHTQISCRFSALRCGLGLRLDLPHIWPGWRRLLPQRAVSGGGRLPAAGINGKVLLDGLDHRCFQLVVNKALPGLAARGSCCPTRCRRLLWPARLHELSVHLGASSLIDLQLHHGIRLVNDCQMRQETNMCVIGQQYR